MLFPLLFDGLEVYGLRLFTTLLCFVLLTLSVKISVIKCMRNTTIGR